MQLSPEGLPRSEPQAEAAAPAAAPPPAQIDEYEIIRPVGRGATGQVYQALDTVLGRSVAVKVLASDKPSQNSFDRFLVEARAIARLQHPNVLAIHRVGVAHGRPYLVEEFLRGESLDQIPLPLAWPRVLNIAVQLARGLAAAHRQGVLHRDIKPANVMLLPDGTAKLLDFGLAKLSDQLAPSGELGLVEQPSPGAGPQSPILRSPSSPPAIQSPPRESAVAQRIESQSGVPHPAGELAVAQTLPEAAGSGARPPLNSNSPSLTLAGSLLGTPAYMAPEAWRGEAAGAQSDVYSFGALLYELCAGHPPHNFDQLEDISRAARETDVRPLSTLVPTVNRRLAGMIDRCLRREPGERYPTAELLQLELEGLAAELSVPTAQAVIKQALRRRWRLTALAAVVLLASPILVIRQLMHPPASAQVGAGPRSQRQAVAILGLLDRGAGREHAGFAAALSDLLGAELAVGERLRRIPADSVARMQTELRLPPSEQYSPQQLARIRQNMDADLLLTGSYAPEGAGRLRISIFVLDVQSGSQRALASVAGSPSELFGLVARTGRDLRRQLGLAELSSAQEAELRASRPANPQLAQLYAQGRERLRHFDAVGARPLLEQVATGDVDYPLGHLAMAEVWTQLGYEEKAKAEAKRAFELASNLPREDRYLIEARYREASKDWDKAIALYRSLQTFFPDALDYGLALASAQQSGGDIAAAQTTLRELRARLPRAGSDPRVDILQAKLTLDGGDPMAALALFDKATRQGEDNGAPLLIARARLEAAYALESTGQHDRALQYAKTAQELFAGAGDRGAAADALMAMGAAYMFQGDFGRALATADDALALLLEIQNSSLSAAHLCNMAQLLAKRGDLALARSRAEGGLLLARELGLKETIGGNYLIIGWISLLQGQPDQALRAYAQAETIFNELADPRMIAWIQWHIGQAYFAKGDIAQSRKHHDESLAIREKHGLKGFAAESRAALAALAIEEGRAAEAEPLALAAAEQFAEEQQADNEAWARTLLAEARVAQGRVAEGLRELERARQQSATTQNAVIGFLVRRKNLELAVENPKNKVEILRALDSLLDETRKLGFLAEQLEIKLLKQRALLAASSSVEPAQMIQDIVKQADAAGLGLIAIKANKLIGKRRN